MVKRLNSKLLIFCLVFIPNINYAGNNLFEFSKRKVELIPLCLIYREELNSQTKIGPTLAKNMNYYLNFQKSKNFDKKSPSKAFFMSLLAPGLGQKYVGYNKSAIAFITVESALWLTYLGFWGYGTWIESDYKSFSAEHAGVIKPDDKPKKYFIDISNYSNILEYNERKRFEGNYTEVYPETKNYYWQWDSEDSRKKFSDMRVKSDTALNNSLFVIAGVIINHIVSGIHSARIAKKYNEQQESEKFNFNIDLSKEQISLKFSFNY
jgi:hypothetical protein